MIVIYKDWQRQLALKEKLAVLERSQAQIGSRNQDIESQLQQLQDPAFLEKEARQKFNYQREGEKAVIFVEPSTSSPVSAEAPKNRGFFTKFIDWLKLLLK